LKYDIYCYFSIISFYAYSKLPFLNAIISDLRFESEGNGFYIGSNQSLGHLSSYQYFLPSIIIYSIQYPYIKLIIY